MNEAFAAQILPCVGSGIDGANRRRKINFNGGAIKRLVIPLGCSGARIGTTLINLMERKRRADLVWRRYCIGLGRGIATVFERV